MENIRELPVEERIIRLMRKCGHYLHHSVNPKEADNNQLLSALNEQEKAELETLLQKCISEWK